MHPATYPRSQSHEHQHELVAVEPPLLSFNGEAIAPTWETIAPASANWINDIVANLLQPVSCQVMKFIIKDEGQTSMLTNHSAVNTEGGAANTMTRNIV